MSKIVSFLIRRPGIDDAELQRVCLESLATLAVPRVVVSFVDVDPAEVGLDPASVPPRAYDAVVEICEDSSEIAATARDLEALLESVISFSCSYLVREIVQKRRERTWPLGQRSPGVKGIYPVTRLPDASREEFVRHWREVHAPLALRHHVGMSQYVQNVVLEPLTPDAPAYDGISELHFPTARDMRERFIDSPEGASRIAADVSRFVETSLRLDASEYVLRAGKDGDA